MHMLISVVRLQDAVFTGVGLFAFGSARYLAESMKNFLAATTEDGKVPGCLTPNGPSKTLYHAKPVIIQGAWLAAKQLPNGPAEFKEYAGQMRDLLNYWDCERKHSQTGLYVWFDQVCTLLQGLYLENYIYQQIKHTKKKNKKKTKGTPHQSRLEAKRVHSAIRGQYFFYKKITKLKTTFIHSFIFSQMESGADNLVTSASNNDCMCTSATDVMVFLFR
jgi:hypothetical protein